MMDCKDFEKKIPAFIENGMNDKMLRDFLEHAELCQDCMEELTIQVLVSEAMERLEEDGTFDLQKELHRRLQEAEHHIRVHRIFRYVNISSAVLAGIAVAVILVLLMV